ncbi:ABC transporter ATP-binding protein [Coralliovum pocilloporae]|uniref:ABC transporter ATP-binding protein n=1 Tax=Coralliovum pocilloporae TaxID=3066369 RepID=UPI003D9C06C2
MSLYRWLESLTPSFPDARPDMPPQGFWTFIIHYARPFWPLLAVTSLLATVVGVLDVLLFSFVGDIVDWLSSSNRETFWQDHSSDLLVMGILTLIVLPVLKFIYEAILHQGLLGNFAMRIRWQAHRYLLRQSLAYFQDDFAGRLATKIMQTSLAIRDTVLKITEVLLYVVVYFTAAVVMFAATDIRLSAPMILWFTGYLIILRYYVPKMSLLAKEQADERSGVTGRIVDSYTNIATVKMFADAHHEDAYAREGMDRFLQSVFRMMRLSTNLTSILHLLNGLLIFSVGAVSVWLWQAEAVTAGAVAFAMGLVLRLQGMSQWILWEVFVLFENIGVVRDGMETIACTQSVVDRPGARKLDVAKGSISYQTIHFNYGKGAGSSTAGVIDNLSLSIAPGEKIGLVGRSGAGKSTLVSLLLRFYDIETGRIEIDGQDVSAVTQDSLRQAIGMVTQDTSLLHRSVYDNICYGNPDASWDDVMEAARKASAHDFILGLEDMNGRSGYDAHVGERGVKLSGGQRQRIAIARVLLKNAPILVLDEATSALDSEVEAAIQENLYELMEGKTVIAIAHRLSTIAAMDRLVVMDQGRIVEEGTHDELLARGGLYASLWARQSGGFLSSDLAVAE